MEFINNEVCKLNENEVECYLSRVSLIYESECITENVLLRLTNFRLILKFCLSDQNFKFAQIPLAKILDFDIIPNVFYAFKKTYIVKIKLRTVLNEPSSSQVINVVKIRFKDNNSINEFEKHLKKQLERRSWETNWMIDFENKRISELVQNLPKSDLEGEKIVGIGGIKDSITEKSMKTQNSLNLAFKDLDTLFSNASEIIRMAQRLVDATKNPKEELESEKIFQFIQKMGISKPVMRSGVDDDALYHEELAREIDEFLRKRYSNGILSESAKKIDNQLKDNNDHHHPIYGNHKGNHRSEKNLLNSNSNNILNLIPKLTNIISLPDLYCTWNRARGSALVSPKDLLSACKKFDKIGLNSRLISLQQGTFAVSSDYYNEEEILRLINEFILEKGPHSIAQISTKLHMPVSLCTHYLLLAECKGYLCRDESIEGLVFWPNMFKEMEN